MTYRQRNFESLQRKYLNNKGNITLVGIVMTLLLTTLTVIIITAMDKKHQQIKTRAQTYLCFRFISSQTKKHIQSIAVSNKLITTAFIAAHSPIPAISGPAKITLTTLMTKQNFDYIYYLKKLNFNKYCSRKQSTIALKVIPFNILKRNFDKTAKLIKKKWSFTIPSSNISANPIFIRGTFYLSGRFSKYPQLKTTELRIPIFQI